MSLLNINKKNGDEFTAAEVNAMGKAIDDNTKNLSGIATNWAPQVSQKTVQTGMIVTLQPNSYNVWANPLTGKLKVTLADMTTIREYNMEFVAAPGLVLELDPAIKWVNGEKPIFEAGKTYVINIANKLAVGGAF